MVCVTVTLNVAAVPPALLAIEPVHVPAVGDDDAMATAKVTDAPADGAVAEPTAAIIATVPGELFAPTVQVSVGVNVGAAPLCETVIFCVVGVPPMTSATLLVEIAIGPAVGVAVALGDGDGDGDALADGEGLGEAVPVAPISSKTAGVFAVSVNDVPVDGNVSVDPDAVAGPDHAVFHACATGS